jgi:hypothetical protein
MLLQLFAGSFVLGFAAIAIIGHAMLLKAVIAPMRAV